MRRLLTASILVVASVPAFAQAVQTRIAGVAEPAELTGEPKKVVVPTDAEKQFLRKAVESLDANDATKLRVAVDALTEFVQQEPDYSDAYLMRAAAQCFLSGADAIAILADVAKAISTHSISQRHSAYRTLADHYSFRAKVEFDAGRYREAMDDLDAAIRQDYREAQKVFGSGGVEPDTTSLRCQWSKPDLDALVRRFPGDYRARLYRGLYVSFFVTFKEEYYQPAFQDFDAAARLNPKSPLPYYFTGYLHTRHGGLFSKESAQCIGPQTPVPCGIVDERHRKAIEEYTKALVADSQFAPALALRADAYYSLQRYREAIRDYDRLLELDSNNDTAYNDRGLAKMALGEYPSAVFDFGEALRRRKPDADASTLFNYTFDNRADAYLKMGDFRNAIADITSSIRQSIGNAVFLMNIRQFRAIYPEYKGVSDEVLSQKLHALFFPEVKYEDFAERFLRENEDFRSAAVPDLYLKRGDAYLRLNDFNKATAEYDRALNGFPDSRSWFERWRPLGSGRGGDYFLDVKTIEFPKNGIGKLWMKDTTAGATYSVLAYEIDCRGRRLKQVSSLVYDSNDTLLRGNDLASGWQQIAPQTIGEQLYDGACQSR